MYPLNLIRKNEYNRFQTFDLFEKYRLNDLDDKNINYNIFINNEFILVKELLSNQIFVQKILISDQHMYELYRNRLKSLGLYVSVNGKYLCIKKQKTPEELDILYEKHYQNDLLLTMTNVIKNELDKIISFTMRRKLLQTYQKDGKIIYKKTEFFDFVDLYIGYNEFDHCVFNHELAIKILNHYGLNMKVNFNIKTKKDIIFISYVESEKSVKQIETELLVNQISMTVSSKNKSPKSVSTELSPTNKLWNRKLFVLRCAIIDHNGVVTGKTISCKIDTDLKTESVLHESVNIDRKRAIDFASSNNYELTIIDEANYMRFVFIRN